MAVLDLEEQEQLEQIKAWLKEYGPSLIVGLCMALIAFFGYQRWSQMRERSMFHASVRYEQLLDDLAANNVTAANSAADYLIKRYPKSTYAKLAELLLARRDISQNDLAAAQKKLQDVTENANVPAIREIARVRLARLQIQEKQPQDALKTLAKLDAPQYLATASAVKGDAYLALNNNSAARLAYQQAVAGLPEGSILKPFISMKLNNIPT